MRTIRITAALIIAFCIGLTACGGGSGGSTPPPPPPPPTLSSITVSSTSTTVVVGTTLQMKAEGKYSDGSTKDMTSSVTWSSSDTNVATVSASGLVTAVTSGTVNIKAVSGSISNQSAITVNKANITAIALTAASTTIPLGASQQVVATATYENNTTGPITEGVTWASSDSSIIAVSETGMATAKASKGTADIVATAGGKTSPALTLTAAAAAPKALMLYPASPTIGVFEWVQPTAYLAYTDSVVEDVTASTSITVADSSIASISSPFAGTLVGNKAGATKLTATYKTFTAEADVTVSGQLTAVAITPKTATVHQGGEVQFIASGTFNTGKTQTPLKYVSWLSSQPALADFTAGKGGILNGYSAGTVKVTGTTGSLKDQADVVVDALQMTSFDLQPVNLDMAVNVTSQITNEATFSDGGSQTDTQSLSNITWESSDETVAKVDSNGLVKSLAPGTATITATLPGGTKKLVGVTVAHGQMDHVAVTPANPTPKVGDTVQFKATVYLTDGRSFDVTTSAIWQSTDGDVALIDRTGKMLALKAGTVTIRNIFGKVVDTTVTVAP